MDSQTFDGHTPNIGPEQPLSRSFSAYIVQPPDNSNPRHPCIYPRNTYGTSDLGEKAGEGKGLNQRYLALEGKVESLTDDQKDELLALMWLGRGAAGETVGMWAELLENARHEDAEGKVGTLMIRASQLGNYLPKGLERLGA